MRVLPTSKLTTLLRLKLQVNIDPIDTSQDDFLNTVIIEYSSAIEDYLDRSIGYGSFAQNEYYRNWTDIPDTIFLALYPFTTITSVNYSALGNTPQTAPINSYYANPDSGLLYVLPELFSLLSEEYSNGSGKPLLVTVDHSGGYTIPDNYIDPVVPAVGELPRSIESTTIDLCKGAYYTRTANPLVKTEMVPDVLQQTYFSPEQVAGGGGGVLAALTNISSYQDNRII